MWLGSRLQIHYLPQRSESGQAPGVIFVLLIRLPDTATVTAAAATATTTASNIVSLCSCLPVHHRVELIEAGQAGQAPGVFFPLLVLLQLLPTAAAAAAATISTSTTTEQ